MKISFFIFLLLLGSCAEKSNPAKQKKSVFYPTYTKNLEDNIQTIELEYVPRNCACGNWAHPDDVVNYQDIGKLSEHCVFIEPADSIAELVDTLGYAKDVIKFTGQFYKETGFPKNYLRAKKELSAKAKVFRYTKYLVISSNYRNIINDTTSIK